MLYRVRVDLSFVSEADAKALYEQGKSTMLKATKLTRVSDLGMIAEKSFVELHQCYHDEAIQKPCGEITRVEV